MTLPTLDGKKIWQGVAEAYGEGFVIEIAPAQKQPGYYYMAVTCLADGFVDETKKPVLASAVKHGVQYFLKKHGLVITDITWRESKTATPAIATQEIR